MNFVIKTEIPSIQLRPLREGDVSSSASSRNSKSTLIQDRAFSWFQRIWRWFRLRARPELIYWASACFGGTGVLIAILYYYLFLRTSQDLASNPSTAFLTKGHPTSPYISREYVPLWLNNVSLHTTPAKCHSHNDYWRPVPLFSALAAGCTGIEADVWLRGGDLLVGHVESVLSPDRTLESLYLNPLLEILNSRNPVELGGSKTSNGSMHGVFPLQDDARVVLLIDVKTDANETWPVVLRQLRPLRERGYLTHYEQTGIGNDSIGHKDMSPAPLIVVGSGSLDLPALLAAYPPNATESGNNTYYKYHDTFLDAPLRDIPTSSVSAKIADSVPVRYNTNNSYYASVSFKRAIGSVPFGFSAGQRRELRRQISAAKRDGLQPRYWDIPEEPPKYRDYIWGELSREGVEVLSVDDVEHAARGVWDTGYLDSVVLMVAGSVYTFLVSVVIFWLGLRRKKLES